MEIMYAPQNNGPKTALTVAINDADTTITVSDGSILPEAPNVLTIGIEEDAELVLMQSKTGNILTVQRGYNGTVAKAWSNSEWIYRAITAQDVSALQTNVSSIGQGGLAGMIPTKASDTDFDFVLRAPANNLTTTEPGYVLDARQGKALNDALGAIPTAAPNLLINADPGLASAVWNEGTSIQVSAGEIKYTAEMWKSYSSTVAGTVTKVADGMKIAVAAGSGTMACFQDIEGYAVALTGQVVTLVMSLDGVKYTLRETIPKLKTITYPKGKIDFYTTNGYLRVSVEVNAGQTVTLNWAHLSPGDVEIVHVPENPITNLLKTQRYFFPVANPVSWRVLGSHVCSWNGLAGDGVKFSLPTPMRISPTLKVAGQFYVNGAPVTLGEVIYIGQNQINVRWARNDGVSFQPYQAVAFETTETLSTLCFDARIY